MFEKSTKTAKAAEIIKLTLDEMMRFPLLLALVGICIITLSGYLTLFFVIQHLYFGVSVVDFSTIMNFLGCPITTHILQTLFCILCFIIASLILSIFAFTATFLFLSRTFKRQTTFKDFYKLLKMTLNNLLRYATIATFGYMKQVFGILSIPDNLAIAQDYVNGTYVPDVDKYNNPVNILLFPVLAEQSPLQLEQARVISQNLIHTKFGTTARPYYTFTYITYMVLVAISVLSYMLYTFTSLSIETIFLMGLVLVVIYGSFTYLIEIALAVALYNYCHNKEFLIYSSSFIGSLFDQN